MPDTSPQLIDPAAPSEQIESLLSAVAAKPDASEGMRTMMQRPGYPEYAAKTSVFFPLPPKRV